jgi:hypothetical protein
MLLAAKEETLSPSSDPCVFFLAAFEGVGENSRLGSARRKTVRHQDRAWSNSARALEIEEVLLESRVGCRSSGNTSGGSPQTQAPQQNACTQPILNAVNNHNGTNFTAADVQSPGPFDNGNTTNLIIASGSLSPAQFNGLQTGRYPISLWTWLTGYGPTLHITGQTAFDPAPATFSNSNIGGALMVTFTAHIDYAFPYNPFGAVIHGIDVLLTKLGLTVHPKC